MAMPMSTGSPLIELYVTHVAEEGSLLRVWGQLDRTAATFVERLIIQYSDQFDRGAGACHPNSLSAGQICCAKFGDGGYYRAKILDTNSVSQGFVRLNFVDFGNTDHVPVGNVRSLHVVASNPLVSVESQASSFYLAGVVAPRGVWTDEALTFVKEKICYMELKGVIVGHIVGKRLITLFCEGRDFSDILCEKHLAVRVPLNVQQGVLQGVCINAPVPPSIPVNPPPGLPVVDSNVNFLPRNPVQPQETGGVISAPVLAVGSEHQVFISHIEDGPNLFAVHLKATEKIMQSMIETLNSMPVKPLSQPPIPGTICLGKVKGQNGQPLLLRAVVVNVLESECQLYFVDFGNTNSVPVNRIYELPQQFFNTKSMALRFCLSGIKDLKIDSDVKRIFQKLVGDKILALKVVEPEGPPLKQYGILYKDGETILNQLKENLKAKEELTNYPSVPLPAPGRLVEVSVSYVESVMHFFVQYESRGSALKSVMELVAKYCSSAPLVSPDELYPGKPVCALFSTDNQWYRARVLSCEGNDVVVLYVDYGNTEKVSIVSLRRIDSTLIQIQTQAALCCLQGFLDSQVTEDQSQRFEELVLEKPLTMKIVSTLASGKMVVELFDMGQAPPVSITSQVLAPPPTPPPVAVAYPEVDEWRPAEKPIEPAPKYGKEQSKHNDTGGEPWKKRSDSWGAKRDEEGTDKPRKWNRDEGDKKWGGGADKEDSGERSWRNRDNRGQGERDGGEKPWRNREDRGDQDGGRKPWQNREERGDQDGGRKPWQNRDEKDGKPWRSRDGDSQAKPWRNKEQQSDNKWEGSADKERRFKPRDDKKWGSGDGDTERRRFRDDDRGDRKFEGRDNKWQSDRGDRKPWNDGERRKKWEDKPSSETSSWTGAAAAPAEDDWGDTSTVTKPSVKAYAPDTISVGAKENVTLVSADDPVNFVVQLDSKLSDLTEMMDKIKTMYEAGGEILKDHPINTPCIARYSEDNTWYRARIHGPENSGAVEVQFVDYGNFESVATSEVKQIAQQFLNIPVFGIRCSLLGVSVPVTEWTEEQVAQFLELTEGKNLEAHFIRKENLFEVILRDTEDSSVSINEKFGASKDSLDAASAVQVSEQVRSTFVPASTASAVVEYASQTDLFISPDFLPDTRENVIVTWFVDPGHFYCQPSSSKDAFVKLVNEIQEAYKGRKPTNDAPSVGCPIVARFPSDKVLYRAVVKEDAGFKFKVQYSDYGNSELLMQKDIFLIEKRFMTLPGQAVLSSLKGVAPQNDEWPKDCAEYDKLFGAENMECVFHDVNEEGKRLVSLFVGEKNIADELVACGVAVKKSDTSVTDEPLAYDLLQGQQISAHVVYIESYAKFFVHLTPTRASEIQAEVDNYTANLKEKPVFPEADLVEQSLCLASPEEGVWYRARLEAPISSETACVQFIDYGDKNEITVDKIQPIPPSLTRYRDQATECFVTGSDKQDILKDTDETFVSEVIDQSVILTVEAIENNRLSVHVFDIEGQRLELCKPIDTSLTCDVESLCPMPVLTKIDSMWVSHVDATDAVWLQKVSEDDTLKGLLAIMQEFYEEKQQGQELPDPQEDMLCAAKSAEDGQWYRARIVSKDEDGQLCVRFVDYGNSEILAADNLKTLDNSFCHLMSFALCTSLAVVPKDADACVEEITALIADATFDVTFLKAGDLKWIVSVENNVVEIAQHLNEKGLASEMEDYQFVSGQVSLPSDGQCEVAVSHFEDPDEIWVQQFADMAELFKLQEALIATAASQAVLQKREVGQICIAQFYDNSWYRAKILEINDTTAKVFFVDYGNKYEVDIGSVKKLPKKFSKWPYFAVRCCIKNDALTDNTELLDRLKYQLSDPEKMFVVNIVETGTIPVVTLFVDGTDVVEIAQNTPIPEEVVEVVEAVEPVVSEKDVCGVVETASPVDMVIICYVNSPSEFWIQKNSDGEILDKINEGLAAAESFDHIEVSEGMVCAAMFPDDGMWYRAKIISAAEEKQAYFIDFGNSSPVTEIRKLPDDLASYPPIASCCSFAVPPGVDEWPEAAVSEFLEVYGDGSKEFELSVLEEGDRLIVSLRVDGKNVESELLKKCDIKSDEPEAISEDKTTGNATVAEDAEPISVDLVSITNVYSPGEFWIQKSSQAVLLESITKALEEAENFEPVENASEGLICAAKFPDDDMWYRAKLISIAEEIEAYFIDYGNSSPVTEIRILPADLAAQPPVAIRCSFALPQNLESWPEVAENEFMDIFGDGSKEFELTVVEEGDPLIVSLKIDGITIENELLKKCDIEALVDEDVKDDGKTDLSDKSNDIEILSVAEETMDIGSVMPSYDPVSPVLLDQPKEVYSEDKCLKGEKEGYKEIGATTEQNVESPVCAAKVVLDTVIDNVCTENSFKAEVSTEDIGTSYTPTVAAVDNLDNVNIAITDPVKSDVSVIDEIVAEEAASGGENVESPSGSDTVVEPAVSDTIKIDDDEEVTPVTEDQSRYIPGITAQADDVETIVNDIKSEDVGAVGENVESHSGSLPDSVVEPAVSDTIKIDDNEEVMPSTEDQNECIPDVTAQADDVESIVNEVAAVGENIDSHTETVLDSLVKPAANITVEMDEDTEDTQNVVIRDRKAAADSVDPVINDFKSEEGIANEENFDSHFGTTQAVFASTVEAAVDIDASVKREEEAVMSDINKSPRKAAEVTSDSIVDVAKDEKDTRVVDYLPSGEGTKETVSVTKSSELPIEVLPERSGSGTTISELQCVEEPKVAETQATPSVELSETTARDGSRDVSVHDVKEEQSAEADHSESISLPKEEETKSTIQLSEKIVRDFSVKMTIPDKEGVLKSPKGFFSPNTPSPKRMNHADRIVPGSISHGSCFIEEAGKGDLTASSIITKCVDVPEKEEILIVERSLSDELAEVSSVTLVSEGEYQDATKLQLTTNDVPETVGTPGLIGNIGENNERTDKLLESDESDSRAQTVCEYDDPKCGLGDVLRADLDVSADICDGLEFHSMNQNGSDSGSHVEDEIELPDEHYEEFKSNLESPLRNKGNAFLAETDASKSEKSQNSASDLKETKEVSQKVEEECSSGLGDTKPSTM